MLKRKFKLEFVIDAESIEDELDRILDKAAETFYKGINEGVIRDTNGNTVGGWTVRPTGD